MIKRWLSYFKYLFIFEIRIVVVYDEIILLCSLEKKKIYHQNGTRRVKLGKFIILIVHLDM